MTDPLLQELDSLSSGDDARAVFDRLEQHFTDQGDLHRVFDTLLMRAKHDLGAPLTRPTSFDDLDDAQKETFEKAYIEAARTIGQRFLDRGELGEAWVYFRTIREPEAVREAIEKTPVPREANDQSELLVNLALYEGVHPAKGLEVMLRTNGICNTVTATDQALQQMSPEDRDRVARMLVRELHRDLVNVLRAEIQNKMAFAPPSESIPEMIRGREWLFADGNYHLDTSHLNAVVRFARNLDTDAAELPLAVELTEYGKHLDRSLQYPGDPPFDDFYVAHEHLLRAMTGENVDEALAYFKQKLEEEPDESDRVLIASVVIDLALRLDRPEVALDLGAEYAALLEQYTGISYAELCQRTGRYDRLKQHAIETSDPISFVAAALTPAN